MSKIQIKNRWSGSVMFECELSAEVENSTVGAKLGFAVRAAHKSGANLRFANLRFADLSGANLADADLSGADLSGADLRDAYLIDADLRGAVLRDADLRYADLSGADLSDSILSGADLGRADLNGAVLRGVYLRGADLRYADLSGAVLRYADLAGADLFDANLRDVPVIQDIHQAVYAAASAEGALNMSTWHSECGTAHCRAGWVIHLAGAPGAELAQEFGTAAAAAFIYLASDPTLERVPSWYASNEEALADMKRLAEKEASRSAGPATA